MSYKRLRVKFDSRIQRAGLATSVRASSWNQESNLSMVTSFGVFGHAV